MHAFRKKGRIPSLYCLIFVSFLFVSTAQAQDFTIPSTSSTGSFSVTVSNVYSWTLQERVGSSWTNALSGIAGDTGPFPITKPDGTYTYRLNNCYPYSGGCSTSSSKSITVSTPKPPPPVPSISLASTDTDGNFSITWNSTSTATQYKWREKLNDGAWSIGYTTSQTSLTRTGKANGAWSYSVSACNSYDCSNYSAEKTTVVVLTPGTPASISTPGINDGSYTVSWGAGSGSVSHYELEYQKNGGGWIGAYSGVSLSKPFSVTVNGTYSHRVRACKVVSSEISCSGYRTSGNTVVSPPTVAPSLSLASSDGDGSYSVSWGTVSNTKTYLLQEQIGSGGWATVQNINSLSKSFNKTSNTYRYKVAACNARGCGGYSASKVIDVATLPGVPPSITTAGTNDGSYSISWGAASGSFTHYDFDFQKDGGSWLDAYSGTSRTKDFNNNPSVGAYIHRVRACNTVGGYTNCSGFRASGTTLVAVPSSVPVLSVPSVDTDGSYTVSWTSTANSKSYKLEEQVNGGGWTTLQNTSALNKGLVKSSGVYSYRISACNNKGCGSVSSAKNVSITIAPSVPTSISTPDANDGTYTVSWGAATGAVSYYDLDYQINGGSWQDVYSGAARSKSFVGVISGDYLHRVRACNTVNSYIQCSDYIFSDLTVVRQSVRRVYEYDALGRLISVVKNSQAEVGYCYDDAGNRTAVHQGGGDSSSCESAAPVPRTPTGLWKGTHAGGGCVARWNASSGVNYYLLQMNNNSTVTVSGDVSEYTSDDLCPLWIQACKDQDDCSAKANF